MTNYLLDTNHLSPLVTIGHPFRQRFLQNINPSNTLAIPSPVITEFTYGISLLPRARNNITEWQRLRNRFAFYHIDDVIAEAAAQLQISLRRQGRQLGTIDALIAALALANNLVLLTTDRDFETIPELLRENWLNTP